MKSLILSLIILFACSLVNAQEDLVFGAKAGINISDLVSPDGSADDISKRLQYHAGIFGSTMITDEFGAQLELLFSSQGGTELNEFADSKIRITVNYITLPILAKYKVVEGLFVYLGPQIGIAVSSQGNVLEGRFKGKLENMDDTNRVDIGIALGASFAVNEQMFVEARLNAGLTDIEKDEPVFKNQVIQLAVGFPLIGK